MARRSENAIVGITNSTFCRFGRDARNFAVIETGVLQEKQFPYFCLFLAIILCKYLRFVCIISVFFTGGVSGEIYDSHQVGADIRLLVDDTTTIDHFLSSSMDSSNINRYVFVF